MKRLKRLVASILIFTLFLTGVSALAVGDWIVSTSTKSLMNDKQARQALKKATEGYAGYEMTPLALLGTQVVAGTNYCLLCRGRAVTQKSVSSLCKVYVYENLQGQAEITKIKEIKLKSAPSSGWKLSKNKKAVAVDKKVKSVLKEATAGLTGAEYTPLLVLGKAKDAYSLLCRCKMTDRRGTTGLCIVALRKKAGKYAIRKIDDLKI